MTTGDSNVTMYLNYGSNNHNPKTSFYYDKNDKQVYTTKDNPFIECWKGSKRYACYIKDGRMVEVQYFRNSY